jgi:methyl-accepting chemotaxis protein
MPVRVLLARHALRPDASGWTHHPPAKPLAGRADQVVQATASIDGSAKAVNTTMADINTTVKDINGTAKSIKNNADNLP